MAAVLEDSERLPECGICPPDPLSSVMHDSFPRSGYVSNKLKMATLGETELKGGQSAVETGFGGYRVL